MVTSLGWMNESGGMVGFKLKGIIFEKNYCSPTTHDKCRVSFDPHSRQGHFDEEDKIAPYSQEYFEAMSNLELQRQITSLKEGMPQVLRELDNYKARLTVRDQLLLEASHLWKLYCACTGPIMEHQLDVLVGKR